MVIAALIVLINTATISASTSNALTSSCTEHNATTFCANASRQVSIAASVKPDADMFIARAWALENIRTRCCATYTWIASRLSSWLRETISGCFSEVWKGLTRKNKFNANINSSRVQGGLRRGGKEPPFTEICGDISGMLSGIPENGNRKLAREE